jgi:hypothetical protein
LLDDAALRRRLGRAATATVHRRFTWAENARRVVELVQECCAPAEATA